MMMKHYTFRRYLMRIALSGALLGVSLVSMSCVTTYDPYGRPVGMVDPGVAVAGAVAHAAGPMYHSHRHHHYYVAPRRTQCVVPRHTYCAPPRYVRPCRPARTHCAW